MSHNYVIQKKNDKIASKVYEIKTVMNMSKKNYNYEIKKVIIMR